MGWAVMGGVVVGGVLGALGQHDENKANAEADKAKNEHAELGYLRAEGHQQAANNFAMAQYAPYMKGGASAWNAMQQGMGGDGAFNNYNPNTRPQFYGLSENQSGREGGYIPGAQPGQPGGGPLPDKSASLGTANAVVGKLDGGGADAGVLGKFDGGGDDAGVLGKFDGAAQGYIESDQERIRKTEEAKRRGNQQMRGFI